MKVKEDQISIINRESRMEGLLQSKGHLIVEGMIEGSIYGESIFTEKNSRITAKIYAKVLSIAGFFKGEIEAGTLTLLKTANVEGHIRCHRLVVDEGGILNGSVKFISADTSPESPPEKQD
ncbi:MAG: polymer-forming cytoskeletal protein [Deltaproteobacteria bacterium]|nr:polymer-forming cytoskeletal protein [Deltaproteobacteria bacterium]